MNNILDSKAKTLNETEDTLLDLRSVARHLRISERGVWRAVARGDFPTAVKVGRCSRWFSSDLTAYTAKLKQGRN